MNIICANIMLFFTIGKFFPLFQVLKMVFSPFCIFLHYGIVKRLGFLHKKRRANSPPFFVCGKFT